MTKFKVGDIVTGANNTQWLKSYSAKVIAVRKNYLGCIGSIHGYVLEKIEPIGQDENTWCNVIWNEDELKFLYPQKIEAKEEIIRHIINGTDHIVIITGENKTYKKGTSRLHPDDLEIYDPVEGFRIALCRALDLNPFEPLTATELKDVPIELLLNEIKRRTE